MTYERFEEEAPFKHAFFSRRTKTWRWFYPQLFA